MNAADEFACDGFILILYRLLHALWKGEGTDRSTTIGGRGNDDAVANSMFKNVTWVV